MMKPCAIMFTVGWAMAATFGYLALSAPTTEPSGQIVLNILLAFVGLALGAWSWSRIIRGC